MLPPLGVLQTNWQGMPLTLCRLSFSGETAYDGVAIRRQQCRARSQRLASAGLCSVRTYPVALQIAAFGPDAPTQAAVREGLQRLTGIATPGPNRSAGNGKRQLLAAGRTGGFDVMGRSVRWQNCCR